MGAVTGWGIAAAVYHLLSRLAYVLGVGAALAWQHRLRALSREAGGENAYHRFRRWASMVMNNDAVSFVVLAVVTRGTLHLGAARVGIMVVGGLLIVVGVGVKVWAAVRLGGDAYYWHNSFVPVEPRPLDPPGPYRYLDNPMYTVGYLHAYGLALLLGSWPALVAAAFDQASILAFHALVERPHYRALTANHD